MRKLLLVQSELEAPQSSLQILSWPGVQIRLASQGEQGFDSLETWKPDAVVLGPIQGAHGLPTLSRLRESDPRLPVIFIAARDAIETMTDAAHLGAYDCLLEPFDLHHLYNVVLSAFEASQTMKETVTFQCTDDSLGPSCWIGSSPGMRRVFESTSRLSLSDAPVLITGEPGTGKRLIARALYQTSARREQTLLTVNCAAIPEISLENELFGSQDAALAPFLKDRTGRFEQCNLGTVLLHEVGAVPPLVQNKLLRLIHSGEFERTGGGGTRRVNVRVLATLSDWPDPATALQRLEPALLALFTPNHVRLPPLREHKEDIRPLARCFLKQLASEPWQKSKSLSSKAIAALERYQWPGNIGELREVVRAAFTVARGDPILPADLPPHLRSNTVPGAENGLFLVHVSRKPPTTNSEELAGVARKLFVWARGGSNLKIIPAIERELMINALVETKGNQVRAARLLGVTRATLRKRINKFGIEQERSFG